MKTCFSFLRSLIRWCLACLILATIGTVLAVLLGTDTRPAAEPVGDMIEVSPRPEPCALPDCPYPSPHPRHGPHWHAHID